MDIFQSRAERAAAHIRDGIRHHRWRDPLPSSRDWARQLGVSLATFSSALAILRRAGVLRVEPRQGIRLGHAAAHRPAPHPTKRVRLVFYGHDALATAPLGACLDMLLLRLQEHDIHLVLEECSDERLKRICSTGARSGSGGGELAIFVSVPRKYHPLLAASKAPSLLLGRPADGVYLPCVNVNYSSAIRHAAQHLLRRSFSDLTLLLVNGDSPGKRGACDAFNAACREWPHRPITWDIIRVRPNPNAERAAFGGLAERTLHRRGIVLVLPLSVSVLMTTLLGRGVPIPGRVAIAAVGTLPDSVRVHPRPAHYPFPRELFVRAIVDAAAHFFESGTVPAGDRVIPMEIVRGS